VTVRCRGTCKAGHTTEAEAEPGRVTWHGACATEGCEQKVYCRRVPADTPAPPPETRVAQSDPHRVLEVPGYRDEPAPPDEPTDTGDEPGEPAPGATGEPAPAPRKRKRQGAGRRPAGAAAAPAPPVTPTPPRAERPRGLVGRFRARIADDVDDAEDDRLFGHW
jgi:hypothetical protein